MTTPEQQIHDIHEYVGEIQFGIKYLNHIINQPHKHNDYDDHSEHSEHDEYSEHSEHDEHSEHSEHNEHSEHIDSIEPSALCDVLITTSNTILENVQEMKNNFDEETDRLQVLIYKMSMKLPFIDRIKYRAEARGIKLPDFTIANIPKEASPFYGDEERTYEIIRLIEEGRPK
jgi:hypothetical protein